MCNLYDIGPAPNRQAKGWHRQVVEAMGGLPKVFGIRKTDSGLVIRRNWESGSLEPIVMRWGFHREFNPAVNNSRLDKLGSAMWSSAWRSRRCVIPVATFYEWSGGEKGAKQTYAMQPDPGESGSPAGWFWMAGLWEEHPLHGACFSMITREAAGPVAQIHDRMPAILREEDVERFLNLPPDAVPGNDLNFAEPTLKLFPCLNPLKTRRPGPAVEDGFLF